MSKLVENATLVAEVIGDTKTLFELQLRLLQAEIKELANFSKQFVLLGALALAALVPAVFFLGLALSGLLDSLTGFPTWACHAIVFFFLAVASVIPLLKAKHLLNDRVGVEQ